MTRSWTAERPVLVTIRNSSTEERTRRRLEALFDRYDLSPWLFARTLQIDENLQVSSCRRNGNGFLIDWRPFSDEQEQRLGNRLDGLLLSLYIHEQLHAYLDRQVGLDRTLTEIRRWYPQVPEQRQGGARDEASTYLHLILCTLEFDGLCHFLGMEAAREQLAHARGYRWIYKEVLEHPDRFHALLRRCELDPVV